MYTPLLTHACTAASAAGGGIFSGELAQRRDVSPAYRLRLVSSRRLSASLPRPPKHGVAWRGLAGSRDVGSPAPRSRERTRGSFHPQTRGTEAADESLIVRRRPADETRPATRLRTLSPVRTESATHGPAITLGCYCRRAGKAKRRWCCLTCNLREMKPGRRSRIRVMSHVEIRRVSLTSTLCLNRQESKRIRGFAFASTTEVPQSPNRKK